MVLLLLYLSPILAEMFKNSDVELGVIVDSCYYNNNNDEINSNKIINNYCITTVAQQIHFIYYYNTIVVAPHLSLTLAERLENYEVNLGVISDCFCNNNNKQLSIIS